MSVVYQIRVKEHLDPKLSAWFDDFAIAQLRNGETLLTGIVIDQAAMYGVLARCRDLGLTLISVNPLLDELSAKTRGDQTMNFITVAVSDIINARPEDIYAVIADYRVGHPAILPKPYFTGLTVEKGGQGAGTVVLTEMKVWGRKFVYHQVVSEPEPGRLLVETDTATGQYSSFTFEPLNGGAQTRVTITTNVPPSPGFLGLMERLFSPPVTRRIFKQELRNLAEYVSSKRVAVAAS